jgi:hypothetical protein
MIRIEETEVFGFRAALRDMRNPKESWYRSDSRFGSNSKFYLVPDPGSRPWCNWVQVPEFPEIGPNDLELMKNLCWGGEEHRKFLRTIEIWVVLYPSRDIWQELDTYKVDTVRDSCSTMHKLGHRDLVPEDFAVQEWTTLDFMWLEDTNRRGREYRETKKFEVVKGMKKRLIEGFIQRAGYHMNYETAFSMFFQRRYHRMDEWRWTGGVKNVDGKMSICDWIYSLPYMPEILADSLNSVRLKSREVKDLRDLLSNLMKGKTSVDSGSQKDLMKKLMFNE